MSINQYSTCTLWIFTFSIKLTYNIWKPNGWQRNEFECEEDRGGGGRGDRRLLSFYACLLFHLRVIIHFDLNCMTFEHRGNLFSCAALEWAIDNEVFSFLASHLSPFATLHGVCIFDKQNNIETLLAITKEKDVVIFFKRSAQAKIAHTAEKLIQIFKSCQGFADRTSTHTHSTKDETSFGHFSRESIHNRII